MPKGAFEGYGNTDLIKRLPGTETSAQMIPDPVPKKDPDPGAPGGRRPVGMPPWWDQRVPFDGAQAMILAPPQIQIIKPAIQEPTQAAESYADVVAVGSAQRYDCTGILIAPRWVLTARHCLPATVVLFGSTTARAVRTMAVKDARVPPDPAVDAALLELSAAAPFTPRRYRTSAQAAPPYGLVRLVGFGADEVTGQTGFGVKRYVDVSVFGWGCDAARVTRTGCRIDEEMAIPRRGSIDTCDGDSGGPVLEQVDGSYRLIGLTSRPAPGAASRCGDGGIYTRLDRIAGWLAATLSSSTGGAP